jgi:opacity protein-like surface antigen
MKFRLVTAAALMTRQARPICRRRCISLRRLFRPPPVYNWTGCYVGGGGGYAFWQQDSFVTIGGAPVTASQSNGGKGWFGQGQVGCDYQFTAPLFGVQTRAFLA